MSRSSLVAATAAFWRNPVVVRDLRVRLRGSRAFWNQAIYLALLILLSLGAYLTADRFNSDNTVYIQSSLRAFYTFIFEALATMVTLIAPALTAITIISERQRLTLDLLVTSPMTSMQMLTGKLASSIAFLILLLFMSVPASALCVILGGATLADVLRTYVLLIMDGIVFAAIGLAFSCTAKQNVQAIARSYAAIFLMICVATPLGLAFTIAASGMGGTGHPAALIGALSMLSPFIAVSMPAAVVQLAGVTIPLWLATGVVAFLVVRLILTAAALRLGMYRGGLIASLRRQVLLVTFIGTFMLGNASSVLGGAASASSTPAALMPTLALSVFMMSIFFLPALFVPVSDEDAYPPEAVRGAYDWRRMFSGAHSGALPYFHLWLVTVFAGAMVGLYVTLSAAAASAGGGPGGAEWAGSGVTLAATLFCLGSFGFAYWCVARRAASLTTRLTAARPIAFLMFDFIVFLPYAVWLTCGELTGSNPSIHAPLMHLWLLEPFSRSPLEYAKHWGDFAIAGALACVIGVLIYPPWAAVTSGVWRAAKPSLAKAA